MDAETLTIPGRFNGPPKSGNGGYVCGRVGSYLTGPAAVRLHAPPPLDRPLRVEVQPDLVRLLDGEALVAQGRPAALEIAPPAAPAFDEAEAASRRFVGFKQHLLPTCFVCGPARLAGDGLRIFPGRSADERVLAAPWVPHESLADAQGGIPPEFLWAALDCAGAFAVNPAFTTPMLLGEMTARLSGSVTVGERCVVAAWAIGAQGRKHFAGTALFSETGALVGLAQATWIELAQ